MKLRITSSSLLSFLNPPYHTGDKTQSWDSRPSLSVHERCPTRRCRWGPPLTSLHPCPIPSPSPSLSPSLSPSPSAFQTYHHDFDHTMSTKRVQIIVCSPCLQEKNINAGQV